MLFALLLIFITAKAYATEISNKELHAVQGRNIVILLDSNPTTGYGWELARPLEKDKVRLISSVFIPSNDKKLVGAPGKHEWTLKALKKGNTYIVFKYFRPWEKNTPPIKKVVYKVVIK